MYTYFFIIFSLVADEAKRYEDCGDNIVKDDQYDTLKHEASKDTQDTRDYVTGSHLECFMSLSQESVESEDSLITFTDSDGKE